MFYSCGQVMTLAIGYSNLAYRRNLFRMIRGVFQCLLLGYEVKLKIIWIIFGWIFHWVKGIIADG